MTTRHSLSLLFKRAPRWHDYSFGTQKQLPGSLQSWLNETGSLTQRLRGVHGDSFGVSVLRQRWQHAFIDESRLLSQNQYQYQLVREVILHNQKQPLILARTIIPASTLAIAERKLNHLGNRPLGEVIFAYPDLRISQRQFSQAEADIWIPSVMQQPETVDHLWGRRSVYQIHQHPLLVAEFFLPACYS